MMWFRLTCIAAAFALCVFVVSAPASATLDTAIGQRSVVPDQPFSDCSAKANHALTTVMQSVTEAGTGSGNWFGVDSIGGAPSEIAVVECHPQGSTGYAVSFTCSVQTPTSPDTAAALCTKVIAAFGGGATAATGSAP